jgi:hypothetical protein
MFVVRIDFALSQLEGSHVLTLNTSCCTILKSVHYQNCSPRGGIVFSYPVEVEVEVEASETKC